MSERFRWLPRWIVRELEDRGRFSWGAFLMVAALCFIAYWVVQRFGGPHRGVF